MTDESPSAATATSPPASEEGLARYRCAACGNRTRFNVVTSRRTKAFHHYSVGGDLVIEEVEVLDESVDSVSCRWCSNGGSIEVIEDGTPEAG